MNFDPGHLISFFEGRIGRRSTTFLAWLLFFVVLGWAGEFLIVHVLIPLMKFFGATGDLRRDLFSESRGPFWPALITILVILGGSVILFVPFVNILISGRHVPQSVLNDLEERRSWAIHNVLNFVVNNANDLTEWRNRNDQFVSEVTAILEKHFSRADVLRFSRLGLIWNVTFDFASLPDHVRELRMFAKRLDTLEKIVDRYSGL